MKSRHVLTVPHTRKGAALDANRRGSGFRSNSAQRRTFPTPSAHSALPIVLTHHLVEKLSVQTPSDGLHCDLCASHKSAHNRLSASWVSRPCSDGSLRNIRRSYRRSSRSNRKKLMVLKSRWIRRNRILMARLVIAHRIIHKL
jgi:hypothetical protein